MRRPLLLCSTHLTSDVYRLASNGIAVQRVFTNPVEQTHSEANPEDGSEQRTNRSLHRTMGPNGLSDGKFALRAVRAGAIRFAARDRIPEANRAEGDASR